MAIVRDQAYYLRLFDRSFPAEYMASIKATPQGGYEAFQSFASIGERLSLASNRLDADLYLMTARGGAYATGEVQFTRTDASMGAYTILSGTVVSTADGRDFVTTADMSFGALEVGPKTVAIRSVLQDYRANVRGARTAGNGEVLPGLINTISRFRSAPELVDASLLVSNASDTTGGRFPSLDMLGDELMIPRNAGEPDDLYLLRIRETPDTVSPNAIIRGVRKVMASFGYPNWNGFYEIGMGIGGFFLDAGSSLDSPQNPERNFPWDLDQSELATDRWKVLLDKQTSRAFFIIEVPAINAESTGMIYDGSSTDPQPIPNAFDQTASNAKWSMLDGYDVPFDALYKAVYDMVEAKRAGGVRWMMIRNANFPRN